MIVVNEYNAYGLLGDRSVEVSKRLSELSERGYRVAIATPILRNGTTFGIEYILYKDKENAKAESEDL